MHKSDSKNGREGCLEGAIFPKIWAPVAESFVRSMHFVLSRRWIRVWRKNHVTHLLLPGVTRGFNILQQRSAKAPEACFIVISIAPPCTPPPAQTQTKTHVLKINCILKSGYFRVAFRLYLFLHCFSPRDTGQWAGDVSHPAPPPHTNKKKKKKTTAVGQAMLLNDWTWERWAAVQQDIHKFDHQIGWS